LALEMFGWAAHGKSTTPPLPKDGAIAKPYLRLGLGMVWRYIDNYPCVHELQCLPPPFALCQGVYGCSDNGDSQDVKELVSSRRDNGLKQGPKYQRCTEQKEMSRSKLIHNCWRHNEKHRLDNPDEVLFRSGLLCRIVNVIHSRCSHRRWLASDQRSPR
jgi:hypothetical protein